MAKVIMVDGKHSSLMSAFKGLLARMEVKFTSKGKKETVDRLRRWVYIPKITDGGVILSDGTRYAVDGVSGAFHRVFKKGASQRERRRLYGKMRREDGLTRSQAQKRDIELARIGM